tara:strand:+ start:3680 stop:4111 length:432 start_codon:yes stop_codon:yes gene_type:complete
MHWEKLKKIHYHKDEVEYITSSSIFDIQEYNKLYENSNNLEHQVWQDFDKKYKIGYEFKQDVTDIDFNKEIIALWFFRERSDVNSQPQLNLKGKLIPYYQNTFLLTDCKDIKIVEQKKKYIRRPMVQLDVSKKKYNEIIERLK